MVAMIADISTVTSIPGIDQIRQVVPLIREFGVTVTVLFVLLFFGLAIISAFLFKFLRVLQGMEIQETLINDQLRSIIQTQGEAREYNRGAFHKVINLLSKYEIKITETCTDMNEIGLAVTVLTEQSRVSNGIIHDISLQILDIFKRRNGVYDNGNQRTYGTGVDRLPGNDRNS